MSNFRLLPWSFTRVVLDKLANAFISIVVRRCVNSACAQEACFVSVVQPVQLVDGKSIALKRLNSVLFSIFKEKIAVPGELMGLSPLLNPLQP